MDGLCGVWIDAEGLAHVAVAAPEGGREELSEGFRPFAWLTEKASVAESSGIAIEALEGEGPFSRLMHADTPALAKAALESVPDAETDSVRPPESQFLLQKKARLYRDLTFGQLRRCQFDIETDSPDGGFSDAEKAEDRVLAIGLRWGGRNRILTLAEPNDEAEKKLLEDFNFALAEIDPDVIEGHNCFKFDFDYLRRRCRRHRVACAWGRFGQRAQFRPSRLKAAERWLDFPRCDLPGRAVVDTYLLVNLYDVSTREMTSYGLKEAAIYFGITSEGGGRTYIAGDRIARAWAEDPARFRAYLEDDLRETQGLADLLLPTYFEQTRTFPITLQEATLRGTTGKIDLLLLESYYHARQACPLPSAVAPFEGGYTRSFREGVFRHVLHFDVASLYPSLLLNLGRNPRGDSLGIFIPLLRSLREYRLKFKRLAREAPSAEGRAEAQARQSAYKILINSFYGYLGFSGARFGDAELAAQVTRRGRELLQALIEEFTRRDCLILEADTDGMYLSSEREFSAPETLLEQIAPLLPPGIELECDGSYQAMFCYKAKNYALYDGRKIILRGSALRSRGIEPYLQRLTDRFIRHQLGAGAESPLALVEEYRGRLAERSLPVAELAKSESLSQNPDVYERFVEAGGKPRRASAEAALQLVPRPRMGTVREKGRPADWQRARPVSLYDSKTAPYDPDYYLAKLDDWLERYGPFLGVKPAGGVQGELL
jgi:DNA polymerase I